MSMLFKRIKDWATSITAFRTGDVIPVDGPSGTAKMTKDDLLRATAENVGESDFYLTNELKEDALSSHNDMPTYFVGVGLDADGKLIDYEEVITTDYISVTASSSFSYYYNSTDSKTLRFVEYNAQKERVDSYLAPSDNYHRTGTLNSNTAYIRASFAYSDIGNVSIAIDGVDVWTARVIRGDASRAILQYEKDIADGEIFIKQNFVYDDLVYSFGFYLNSSGEEVIADNYKTTDYIPVIGSKSYTADFGSGYQYNTNQGVCFYDANKTFISSYTTGTNDHTRTFTTPGNAKFLRFSCSRETKLDASLKYIDDTYSVADDVKTCFSNFAITKKGTTYTHSVLGIEKGYYLNANGSKVAAATYKTTDYIPVIPERNYTAGFGTGLEYNVNQGICFYDRHKTFISSYTTNTSDYSRTFTTPKHCFFVRWSSSQADDTGSTLTYNSDAPYCWSKEYNAYTDEVLHLHIEKFPVYAIIGKDLRVYADNLFFERHNEIDCSVDGKFYGRNYYEEAPSSASETFTLSKYDGDFEQLKLPITISSVASNTKNEVTENVLVIGDSFTNYGVFLSKLNTKASAVGYTINFLGTRGSTIHHEGRPAWGTYEYTHLSNFNSLANAFYNPITEKFDFQYYLAQNSITTPDVVIIELGVNDTWNNMHGTTTGENLQEMVDSIHDVNPNIKIVLTGTAVAYAGEDASVFILRRRKRQLDINNQIIDRFAETANVFVQIMSVNFDPIYSFALTSVSPLEESTETIMKASDTTHPANAGWNEIADTLLATLLNI